MAICVVGSIAFDSVQTPFGECNHVLGGAANYFSVAASFFSHVKLVGVVGDDFPQAHLSFLQDRQIDTAGVVRNPGKTFHWKGSYGFDLNEAHTLKTELNVFADFLPELPRAYRQTETVFLANIDPELQLQVLSQVDSPKLVALDTMNFWITGKQDVLRHAISKAHVLLINDAEIRQLTGEHNIVKAVRDVEKMGPSIVVVKRGEYGAMLFYDGNCFSLPAYPLEDVYDPTGAGDTFAGGFLGWLDKTRSITESSLKQAMMVGTIMASFVIESFSFDRLRDLTLSDIENRLAAMKQLCEPPRAIQLTV